MKTESQYSRRHYGAFIHARHLKESTLKQYIRFHKGHPRNQIHDDIYVARNKSLESKLENRYVLVYNLTFRFENYEDEPIPQDLIDLLDWMYNERIAFVQLYDVDINDHEFLQLSMESETFLPFYNQDDYIIQLSNTERE